MTHLPLVNGRVSGRTSATSAGIDAPAETPDGPLGARLAELRARYGHLDGVDLLTAMLKNAFPGKIAVVSSFGAESVVLLHLVAQVDPATPVLFLNTGKLFAETLRYRDRLQEALGLTDVRALYPHPEDERGLDPHGALWSEDPDACCRIRKVLPLGRALQGFEAQVTGRKRFQTSARSTMDLIEVAQGRFKINPLADWGLERLTRHIEAHRLPRHPLVKDGYASIGCMPCTRRVRDGEAYRSGRWAGLDKDECGLHTPALTDGDGI